LVPADGKLTGSNGNYVYNVTKSNDNSYYFTVKPSETTAGPCKVTLNADYFIGEIINITQIVPHALKMSNETERNNNYNAQVCYTLDEKLSSGTTYTFRCKIRASSALNKNNIEVFLQESANGNGKQQYGLKFKNDITTSWEENEITITPDRNRGNIFDMITFNIGKFVGDVYLDDVSLKQNNNSPELMKNNDFETGNGAGWSIKGNATFEIVPEGYVAQ
jgi:hypothetical protein